MPLRSNGHTTPVPSSSHWVGSHPMGGGAGGITGPQGRGLVVLATIRWHGTIAGALAMQAAIRFGRMTHGWFG